MGRVTEKERRRRFCIVLAMMRRASLTFDYPKATEVATAIGASLPTARKLMAQAANVIGTEHMTELLAAMLEDVQVYKT
ncbi:hypothetical protein D3C72_699750 [compost metagenome]